MAPVKASEYPGRRLKIHLQMCEERFKILCATTFYDIFLTLLKSPEQNTTRYLHNIKGRNCFCALPRYEIVRWLQRTYTLPYKLYFLNKLTFVKETSGEHILHFSTCKTYKYFAAESIRIRIPVQCYARYPRQIYLCQVWSK